MDDLPEHFPSLSVCLEKCIEFERNPVSGPAAQRGTRIHHYIHGVLTGIIGLAEAPKGYRKAVVAAAKCAGEIGGDLLLAEETIHAEILQYRIPCTPDFVVRSNEGIVAINWKTGSERNYRLAQRFYTVALCQKFGVDSVLIVEAYVDLAYAKSYTLSLANSMGSAEAILRRYLLRGSSEANACEFCRWCAKGPTGNMSCDIGCAQLVRG
jgi:hypothetical protein